MALVDSARCRTNVRQTVVSTRLPFGRALCRCSEQLGDFCEWRWMAHSSELRCLFWADDAVCPGLGPVCLGLVLPSCLALRRACMAPLAGHTRAARVGEPDPQGKGLLCGPQRDTLGQRRGDQESLPQGASMRSAAHYIFTRRRQHTMRIGSTPLG